MCGGIPLHHSGCSPSVWPAEEVFSDDKGKECFQSGANAAISGDMLTTAGITVQKDMEMLKALGYKPQLWED